MKVNIKGARVERNLLNKLAKDGYVVHRVAGSGMQDEAVCDLIAVKDSVVLFLEAKGRKKIYYSSDNKEQLKRLLETANKCGAKPILAVKINYKKWQFFNLNHKIPEKVE